MLAYMDDIIIHSKTVEQHEYMEKVKKYRRELKSIEYLPKIAKPLYVQKLFTLHWSPKKHEAFDTFTNILNGFPILQDYSFNNNWIVRVVVSDYALRAILSQGTIRQDRPVAYASRFLVPAERNYSVIEKELLAMIFGIKEFKRYLYGRMFTLLTSHRPVVWLQNLRNPHSRLARWRVQLQEYTFRVVCDQI